MRFTPRFPILAPAFLAAVALTSGSAFAETLHVPFRFVAAGKQLPAGDYQVQRDAKHDLVQLKCACASANMSWILTPGEPSPTDKGVVLRFDHSAAGYALRSIQYDAQVTPRIDHKQQNGDDSAYHEIRGTR